LKIFLGFLTEVMRRPAAVTTLSIGLATRKRGHAFGNAVMTRLTTLILLVLFIMACNDPYDSSEPKADEAKRGDMENTKIFDMPYLMRDLDNGLRVIVVPTDYPDIVTLQIPVQTGSRNEIEPGKTGFAHFF
jgi:zinc protease